MEIFLARNKENIKSQEDQIKLFSVLQDKLTSIFCDVDWMSPEQKNKTKQKISYELTLYSSEPTFAVYLNQQP